MSGYIGAQPVPQATQTRQSFTATANQTSFGTLGYQVDYLDVFLNGVKLNSADYVATNGSDIVLGSGCAVNDILEMVAYSAFVVANQTFTGTTTVDTLTVTGNVDGRDVSVDGTKLDGIEASATADQTNAEIKTAVEAGSDIALGGNPTTTTQSAGNNTTRIATTAFTQAAITALVDSSPDAMNTLNELAAAMGDDASFSTTVTNSIATKLPLAGGTMTGTLGVSTAANNYVTVTATNNNTRAGYLSSSKKSDGTVVKTWIRSEEGGIGSIFTETNHNLGFATNNAAPQMTLSTSGNLGIGTSSPNSPLEVSNGTENQRIAFASGVVYLMARNASAYITQEYTANLHKFTGYGDNSSNEAMRIDSSGNLLVGGTVSNPAYSNTANQISLRGSVGTIEASRDGGAPLELNRKSSFGGIAQFRKDGSVVGSIGAPYTNELSVSASGTNSAGILLSNANQVRPMKNGSTSSSTQDLGASNGLWKDLYLSGGVFLGGTAAANKLGDYEEGTWTPSLAGLSNTPSYYNLTGKYTKIGRHVTVQYFAQTGGTAPTFSSSTAEMKVTGLPFTVLGSGYSGSQGTVNSQAFHYHGSNNNQASVGSAAVGGCYLTAAVTNGASPVMQFLVTSSGNTRGIVNNAGAAQGFILEATVTYFTSD